MRKVPCARKPRARSLVCTRRDALFASSRCKLSCFSRSNDRMIARGDGKEERKRKSREGEKSD